MRSVGVPAKSISGLNTGVPISLSQKCVAVTNTVIPFHPCLHPLAHHTIARLHLPVAPRCNTCCGYCERDISPEAMCVVAPGVSARLLTPEQALSKTRDFLNQWGKNSVVGVAGPGEPLANEQTLETLRLIRREYPEITLCLCTNGLNLPDRCEELHDLGVRHLSITINGFDPSVVAQIQPSVSKDGRVYEGNSAAELLIRNQKAGLEAAVEFGMAVKINCVVVAEINGNSVISTARQVKALGAHVFNPVPLIPRGSFRGMNRPDDLYMARLRSLCSGIIPVFHHCKQCRADAEGIPGKEEAR
jgi:nitrogen fixation protein NifB